MSKIDPWGKCEIDDYEASMDEFGIEPLKNVKLPKKHFLFESGFVYGHKDIGLILDAIKKKKRFVMLTGLMPSGKMHLGHSLVVQQMVYFQSLGAECNVLSADVEAYLTRGLDRKKMEEISEDYFLNYIALGLKKCKFYYQSEGSVEYNNLSKFLAKKVTFNEMKAVYGELSPGKIVSALIQYSDILQPQLKENGGPCPVVVPVGIDQLPHINVTRDLAYRYRNEYGFVMPSATFNKLLPGLKGGKMSSSEPDSAIFFDDSDVEVGRKVMRALTGGRDSIEEQRKSGGRPEICPVFAYHSVFNSKESERIRSDCKKGRLMCGECKKELNKVLAGFLKEHNAKKKEAKRKLKEYF